MENAPPPAEELLILDRELRHIEARRAQLLARRAWLLAVVQQSAAPRSPFTPPTGAFGPPPLHAPKDTTPRSVQNVLLTLGGALLTIAAVAFTLVSWGQLGIGGRSAVLAAVTALALTAPALLLRRRLVSTAEAVAAIGLALTVLDAYALHRFAAPDTDGLAYTAVSAAALTALWTAYGLGLRPLRIPLPAALVAAQLPFVLWSAAAGAGPLTTAWALLATATLDIAVTLWATGRALRAAACAGACLTGAGALLVAGVMALTAQSPAGALPPAALLSAAAALALFAAWRAPSAYAAVPASAVAALAVLAAAGSVVRPAVPGAWVVPVFVLCAVALLAAVRAAVVRVGLPGPLALGLAGSSAAVLAMGALWAVPLLVACLAGPLAWVANAWAGAPTGVRSALSPELPWSALAPAPLVLLTVAAVIATARRTGVVPGRGWRTPAACAVLALAWAAAYTVPAALNLGYVLSLPVYLLVTAAALAVAVRPALVGARSAAGGPLAHTALGCAITSAVSVALLSLAARSATFAVLGVLLGLFAVAAARAGGSVTPSASAATAVALATGLAGACGAALHLPAHHTALVVLGVPAAATALAARLRGHVTALPLEASGAPAALVAIGLAVGHAPALALVLALCGVIASGAAVRPDRRHPAGYAAAGLFLLATWVRLAASDVTTPEAYTLPVTAGALLVGALRRRRDPQASSWTAYGPGLAATLLPSLVAAWGDSHWLRPLLLGAAALAVTLVGARHRLQALLVLGSTALALVALHELAPYVVQVVGVLPRWLPPALAGLLLLGVGATYEQRLRDARRLRETLGRMR
ncbi:SCO7613 C-terminal domain-containing membrane protein [Streptomyces hypolithicus]